MLFFRTKRVWSRFKLKWINPSKSVCFGLSVLVLFVTFSFGSDESKSVFKLGERFFSDSLYNLALEQYQKYLTLKRDHENDPAAYYKMAFCHYKMGNIRDAAEGFEDYIRLFPSETKIMDIIFLAGETRKELGEFKEASDWFYSVWSRFVGSAKAKLALFEAAYCSEKDNNFDRAIELYSLFVNKFPNMEHAKQSSLSLVNLYIDRQDYTRAEEILAKAEKKWKSDKEFSVRVLYYMAFLAKNMQKIELAEKKFRQMASVDKSDFPEREAAYKAYIDILTIQKSYKEAQAIFSKLKNVYTEKSIKPKALFYKKWGDNARKARLYKDAVPLYQKLLDEYSSKIDKYQIQYRLTECYVGMGDFPKAIENLRSLELQDSAGDYSARAVLKTGELYFNKGLFPSAISAYRRYLQLPDRSDKDRVIYRIGKIYQEKYKRFGAAVREFENLFKLYPASQYYQKAVFSMAQCQEALKEYEAAVRNYEYISESGGDSKLVSQAEKRASYIRDFLIKDFDAAVFELADLVNKEPSSIAEYERQIRTAAIFEKYLKDYTKALELYKKADAVPNAPDSIHAHVNLVMAHIHKELFEKATVDNNSELLKYSKDMALKKYQGIIDKFGNTGFADDAAFNIMMLTSPNIGEFESFISAYPKSRYLAEVFFYIAKHYEERAVTSGSKFSKKAVTAYTEIVERFPSSEFIAQALVGLARNHLVLGEYTIASEVVDRYIDRFTGSIYDAEMFCIRGILTEKKGDYSGAVDIFKQMLYRFPFSTFAERSRYELAAAEYKINKIFDALSNYRLYQQNYPDGRYAREAEFGVARCLFQLGKREKALEIFNKLTIEKLPREILAEVHHILAEVAESEEKIYDALNHYKMVLSIKGFKDELKVHKKMGTLYFDNRIYNDATSSFEKALNHVTTEPDSVEIITRIITATIMDGKSKKAGKRIAKFKDRFGKKYRNHLAEIIYHEGLYHSVKKDYDKARKRFEYILQKHVKSDRVDDAAYDIALAHYNNNKPEDALKLFQKFPVEYPTSDFVPLAYFKIAIIFHGQNEFIRSAEYFSKVVSDKRTDSKTRFRAANNAAMAYQKTSSWLDAANMYSIIMSDYVKEIHKSSFHLKLGFCLVMASRIEDAFKHFKEANKAPKEEDKPEIIYWLATCYSKLGDYSKAITEYLKVPYLYSNVGKWGVTAEFEAARLYERQGEYSKAITLYRKIVRSDGEQGRFGKKALERITRLNTLIREG